MTTLATRIATLELLRAAERARMAAPIDPTERLARIVDVMIRVAAGSTDRRCLRVAELLRGAELRSFA